MRFVPIMVFAASTAVATVACSSGRSTGGGGDGGWGASSAAPSSSEGSSDSSSGSQGECLPNGCGSGWDNNCRPTTDTCGNPSACRCINELKTCLHDDLCCVTPAAFGYQTYQGDADARCAKIPGYPAPFICGAVYGWDPSALDGGVEEPWVDDAGMPVSPSARPPAYCVEAPYDSGQPFGWVLWCCHT